MTDHTLEDKLIEVFREYHRTDDLVHAITTVTELAPEIQQYHHYQEVRMRDMFSKLDGVMEQLSRESALNSLESNKHLSK